MLSVIRRVAGKTKSACRRMVGACRGVKYIPPNYAFRPHFCAGDVAIDVGVGDNPDLSIHLIDNYGLDCFVVDPTHRHATALSQLSDTIPGLHYLQYALGAGSGEVQFHESTVNVSGSVLTSHRNVVDDPVVTYSVTMVTLGELLGVVGRQDIAIMKIDVEGAEYELIDSMDLSLLRNIRQLIIEFHHDLVQGVTRQDTRRAIATIKQSGMKAFVYNGRDCLFFW